MGAETGVGTAATDGTGRAGMLSAVGAETQVESPLFMASAQPPEPRTRPCAPDALDMEAVVVMPVMPGEDEDA